MTPTISKVRARLANKKPLGEHQPCQNYSPLGTPVLSFYRCLQKGAEDNTELDKQLLYHHVDSPLKEGRSRGMGKDQKGSSWLQRDILSQKSEFNWRVNGERPDTLEHSKTVHTTWRLWLNVSMWGQFHPPRHLSQPFYCPIQQPCLTRQLFNPSFSEKKVFPGHTQRRQNKHFGTRVPKLPACLSPR